MRAPSLVIRVKWWMQVCCVPYFIEYFMKLPIVLSHYQTRSLPGSLSDGLSSVEMSPDLGLSSIVVEIRVDGIHFPDGEMLGWDGVDTINASENNCFSLDDGRLHKILVYSEQSELVYSLMPTGVAPTMLVSGIPMHRIKGTEPRQDTREKIKTIKPIFGHVLDTTTGLGYTAIEASHTANHVTTIELEPAVLEIARLNPWSRALFDNPRITQLIGDSYDIVPSLGDGSFARIIHDPPAFALAGHLYSAEFYLELYRVLQSRGRIFHYIGNPESKSGAGITRGVVKRLRQAGFSQVKEHPRAFGVVAYK